MENKLGLMCVIPKEYILLTSKHELNSCIAEVYDILRYLKHIERIVKARDLGSK